MKIKLNNPQQTEQTELQCAFSQQPFDDCYCRNVNGRSVPDVVKFCMDNYRECFVYRRNTQQKEGDPQTPPKREGD